MCDFHSILGVAFGEDNFEIRHDPNNSHADMAGKIQNKPLRQPTIFECEWDGEGELPPDTQLIRNFGECPERLVRKIRNHYIKLKEAMSAGKHFGPGEYFSDTAKWWDVWNAALAKGLPIKPPAVFKGNLHVDGSAKLDALALTEVGGNLHVDGSAKLDALALTEVGGNLYVDGSAKLDALTKVGGNLHVYGSAKLDALALKSVNGKPYNP